jgi:hypothetical protein
MPLSQTRNLGAIDAGSRVEVAARAGGRDLFIPVIRIKSDERCAWVVNALVPGQSGYGTLEGPSRGGTPLAYFELSSRSTVSIACESGRRATWSNAGSDRQPNHSSGALALTVEK